MIPDNVTLVVKAPNQQIEDQSIECQSSWTVRQLKGHLSEVYPSKPSTDEQKIIYSGQLLNDNAILKDVLRTYDSSLVHTMHLVCTPKRRMTDTEKNEGPRRRNIPNATSPAPRDQERPVENRPETIHNDQNHAIEMQNYLSSFVNNYGRVPPYPNYNLGEGYLPVTNDPTLLANHMMMMQQAYLQYMQQYANMWQPPAATPAPAAPETPPPAPPAPPADDEDGAARDWLDHLYAASRLAVLFSLVYLYGSPARLLLVLLLCAAGYLHQIGFFRDLQLNPQELPQPPANPNGNAPNPNGNINVNNPNVNVDNQNVNVGNQNVNVDNQNVNVNPNVNVTPNVTAAPENADNDGQSLLAVTWMIFTTFFASLIPDTN